MNLVADQVLDNSILSEAISGNHRACRVIGQLLRGVMAFEDFGSRRSYIGIVRLAWPALCFDG